MGVPACLLGPRSLYSLHAVGRVAQLRRAPGATHAHFSRAGHPHSPMSHRLSVPPVHPLAVSAPSPLPCCPSRHCPCSSVPVHPPRRSTMVATAVSPCAPARSSPSPSSSPYSVSSPPSCHMFLGWSSSFRFFPPCLAACSFGPPHSVSSLLLLPHVFFVGPPARWHSLVNETSTYGTIMLP